MDARAADREVIERVLAEYAAIPYAHGHVETETVFDRTSDRYLLVIVGHVFGILVNRTGKKWEALVIRSYAFHHPPAAPAETSPAPAAASTTPAAAQ